MHAHESLPSLLRKHIYEEAYNGMPLHKYVVSTGNEINRTLDKPICIFPSAAKGKGLGQW